MPATIQETIRAARGKAKMTQKQVGEALGYTSNAQMIVARWETGTKPVPRDKIKALAKLLNIDLADLLP